MERKCGNPALMSHFPHAVFLCPGVLFFLLSTKLVRSVWGEKKTNSSQRIHFLFSVYQLFDGNLLGRWFYLRFGISSQFPELRYEGGRAIWNHGCLPLSVPQIGASEQCIVAFLPSRQCLEPAHSFQSQRFLKK
ncbi:hypothetical protein ASPTUDRAFT_849609 [Aspergillus tubingensis CBS 134.48]|uniref:Uncharacterized protein n=1 Tax=Aspergillus tubingensis (strain CBS 134.48) TaxID=767770 RepID=A0A1L9MTD2_ASPTC|nr:hypothetical protein ASPTUDRAFT_849609 [Aspergillus tubingensis CBS 134.48]